MVRGLVLAILAAYCGWSVAEPYAIEALPTPEGVPFEVSGLAFLPGGELALSIRKGEIWILENPDAAADNVSYRLFATALHEPLGLAWHRESLYTIQRGELTRILDGDDDETADVFRTVNAGWGLTGNYHEYAFGPVVDDAGDFWITLNQTIGPGEGDGAVARLGRAGEGEGCDDSRCAGDAVALWGGGELGRRCVFFGSAGELDTYGAGASFAVGGVLWASGIAGGLRASGFAD